MFMKLERITPAQLEKVPETIKEYIKNRLAKDSWVFLTYKDGYVDGFAAFDVCEDDPSIDVVKDIVICPLSDDEPAAVEYINFYFEQLFAQRFRYAKFEWEAKEGTVFEIAYDAVLVDWDGERDVSDGIVHYKAGK